MPHRNEVRDADLHFVIDPVTRKIQNQSGKVTLIQYDHNSERFTFVVPRHIDGHDMFDCNRVEVHYNNIATGQTNPGLYEVQDLQVTEDELYVTCSWLISKNATGLVGRLAFVVRFECTSENEDGEAVLDYAWSTQPYAEVKIVSGIYNTDEVADEEFADIITQWKQDLVNAGIIESVEQTVTSTEDEGVNELAINMSNGDTYTFEVRNGSKGSQGYSAYDIAVQHGYEGSEEEWNNAVNEARVAAENFAKSADASYSNARRYGELAVGAMTEAEKYAKEVRSREQNVSDMADFVRETRNDIAETEDSIDRSLITAYEYLDDAIAVEENVMSLAEQASTSATNAATSEQNSAKSASNAATSEANASASATSAATSAENASNSASSADSSAIAAAASAAEAKTNADSLNADIIQAQLNLKGDSLYFDKETNLLYLMSGGEIVGEGVAVAASGGGGTGGSYDYSITLKNLLESRVMSFPAGAKVELEFSYSSVDEEGYNDGPGVATIYVNNVKKGTHSVIQGENPIDISDYLTSGTNTVKLSVMNSEGNNKSLIYTITMVTLKLSTTLENYTTQTNDLTFYYTPVGDGTKTVYFYIDGRQIGTQTVISSGKSQSFTIPVQSHGGHQLEVYATMPYEDGFITSEPLTRIIMWVDSEDMTPIIYIDYDKTEVVQGETLNIPYLVHDPAHETTDITLTILNEDGSEYSSKPLTVGRTQQNWVIQDYPVGNVQFKIAYGTTSASKTISVTESPIKFETETDSLALDVNPAGRSNQEANPATWTDGNVTATFSNVGFSGADGWLTDSVGSPMLRILPGGEMTIPYQLFSEDRRDSGLTVEIEMSTNNVRDYDSVVLSCLSGGRGFKITSQYAELKSEQSSISMQFKEEDRVRLSFVVEPKALNRLIYVYVDGIMCGCLQYAPDDNFQQNPATGIVIGAETSGIDIYRVLLYTKGLTKNEIVDNYIAGRALLSERLAANARNDILNDAEEIVISKLPATLPYMIIACPELPQFKDDKKTCTITYVNPADVSKSFYAENVQIDVQGTSSAGYKKKNFKPKFKGGFTYTATGEFSETYKLRDDSIPVSTFCLKADVASSEGANNVELVRFYNDVCPYKTPPQRLDSRVRVGIDGVPIIVFHDDGTNVKFVGKLYLPTLNSL